jgi:hypothetical protein
MFLAMMNHSARERFAHVIGRWCAGSVAAAALALLCVGCPLTARAETNCASGTSVAQYQNSGKYKGYWKYTVTVTINNSHHDNSKIQSIKYDPRLSTCPCVCNSGMWKFDNPSCDDHDDAPALGGGTNGGDHEDDDNCDVKLVGNFDCPWKALMYTPCENDDDDDDDDAPTRGRVRTTNDHDDCDDSNTVTLVFYTLNSPVHTTASVTVTEKDVTCTGNVTGDNPGCTACPTPVLPATWGGIKSTYR